jgi:beta-mannosidase
MHCVSLNGDDWQVKAYEGEDWNWRNAHQPVTRDLRHWIPASVPGSIHHDVWKSGQIPDPYVGRNSLLIEWIPDRTWVYRKSFTVDESMRGQRAELRFEGVDYEAQFFLNGQRLGHHIGMYTPAAFDVSGILNYGSENLLAVVLERAPDEQPQVGRTSKVRTHKSRMTYWWDFCPRMIYLGLWDDVVLSFSGPVRIADVFVQPKLSDDFSHADVAVTVELDSLNAESVTVETVITLDGQQIAASAAEHHASAGRSSLTLTLPIDHPQLWYPNGSGPQPLYTAEIRLSTHSGSQPSALSPQPYRVRFGLRRIEFVPNESAAPDALPYTLVVNGQRTYIKGWNWVPIDVMYGVPRPEKLEHLLTLAQRAHVKMLRIWGGGLIEKRAFYDRCDELGILIWQEFIMSSSGIDNDPPRDAAHIEMMTREAEQIIPRRRNHPSLAIWCGGNELQSDDGTPLDDSHPLLGALKSVVSRLDPDRFWLPTSPTGPVFMNSLENIERDPTSLHDVHGPWEYQGATGQYTLYNSGTSLLHSEFGVEGITNQKTLDAVIPKEHQLPVSLDNPYWQHLGAWWVKEKMWRETFGDLTDVETWVRATQMMQAEGLRYALEADRRRKYQNSGTLPWQFNEPYPMAACTSAVDYYGQPKPSYYAVKHAYAPLHVSARFDTMAWAGRDTFEAEIWVHNSARAIAEGYILTAHLAGSDGTIYGEWSASITTPPDSAQSVYVLAVPLAEIKIDAFFLTLNLTYDDWSFAWNRYVFTKTSNLASSLTQPKTTLTVRQQTDAIVIGNAGSYTAMFVWLEDDREIGASGYVYFSENHFCLLPGEMRIVSVKWHNVPESERRIKVSGWNIERVVSLEEWQSENAP